MGKARNSKRVTRGARVGVGIARAAVACLLSIFVITTTASAARPTGRRLTLKLARALEQSAVTERTRNVTALTWTWVEMKYYDEEHPLTIDIVGSNFGRPRRIAYMLPGSGVNFRSSYFTPILDNLARHLVRNGYLVVGITPREDSFPAEAPTDVMAGWGIEKHREDVRTVVSEIMDESAMPYEMLGFSYSGGYALDYAATYSDRLERVVLLDFYAFDPENEPEKIQAGNSICAAYAQILAGGYYVDDSLSQLKPLMIISTLAPDGDSGMARALLGLPYEGNFTNNGLLHFMLINSAYLPGIHTPMTGLPRDWPLVQSTASGTYLLAEDPLDDEYTLANSNINTLRAGSLKTGSGLIPLVLQRDCMAVACENEAYTVDWSGIEEAVLWINAGEGYGGQNYGAERIRQSGNDDVTTHVIDGYGNGDPLYSDTANEDVWILIAD
jgi:pimeloyl-ACP methyl ester carboxylesterase